MSYFTTFLTIYSQKPLLLLDDLSIFLKYFLEAKLSISGLSNETLREGKPGPGDNTILSY